MTRYVILGAGAVGVTLAAELSAAGRENVLVARGAQLEALQAGALRYLRPEGERLLGAPDQPFVAGPAELTAREDDVLVLATKSQDADPVLAQWSSWGGPAVPVLTLQNGLDAERSALRRFVHVIGGVLLLPASYTQPGLVLSPGAPAVGVLWLGRYPGRSVAQPGAQPAEAERSIAADLRAARFEAEAVTDIRRWKAAKLLSSVTFALEALYQPSDARQAVARAVSAEARAVLEASGQSIADFGAESSLALSRFAVQEIPGHLRGGTSTWQSFAREAPPETDYLNGEIVLLARLAGRTAPLNAAIQHRVVGAARSGLGPGELDWADLAELAKTASDVGAGTEAAAPAPDLATSAR